MRIDRWFILVVILAAACQAGDPQTDSMSSDGKGDDAVQEDAADETVRDLGVLEFPGQVLGGETVEMGRGETLRFRIDGNQIYGVFGFEVDPTDLVVDIAVIDGDVDALGDTIRRRFDVTVPETAEPGREYTLVSQTPYQVREDPNWAFSFQIVVTE